MVILLKKWGYTRYGAWFRMDQSYVCVRVE